MTLQDYLHPETNTTDKNELHIQTNTADKNLYNERLLSSISIPSDCDLLRDRGNSLLSSFSATVCLPVKGAPISTHDVTSARLLAKIADLFVRMTCDRTRHAVVQRRETALFGIPDEQGRVLDDRVKEAQETFRRELALCVNDMVANFGCVEEHPDNDVGGRAASTPDYDPSATKAWTALHMAMRVVEGYYGML